MGGPEVRVKIARIDQETLTPDQQAHFIALIKNAWCTQEEGTLGRLRKMDGKVGRSHRGNQRSSKRRTQNISGNTSELTGKFQNVRHTRSRKSLYFKLFKLV